MLKWRVGNCELRTYHYICVLLIQINREMSKMIMKIFFRDHVKETLKQLIRTSEICNELELISLAEQLLRKMEEYDERH